MTLAEFLSKLPTLSLSLALAFVAESLRRAQSPDGMDAGPANVRLADPVTVRLYRRDGELRAAIWQHDVPVPLKAEWLAILDAAQHGGYVHGNARLVAPESVEFKVSSRGKYPRATIVGDGVVAHGTAWWMFGAKRTIRAVEIREGGLYAIDSKGGEWELQ